MCITYTLYSKCTIIFTVQFHLWKNAIYTATPCRGCLLTAFFSNGFIRRNIFMYCISRYLSPSSSKKHHQSFPPSSLHIGVIGYEFSYFHSTAVYVYQRRSSIFSPYLDGNVTLSSAIFLSITAILQTIKLTHLHAFSE